MRRINDRENKGQTSWPQTHELKEGRQKNRQPMLIASAS